MILKSLFLPVHTHPIGLSRFCAARLSINMTSVINISVWGIQPGANATISPSRRANDPGGLSGPRGRHRNRMNGEPIVVHLCDTASPSGGGRGGSSPESERYYPARVKQTGISPLAPRCFPGLLWFLIIPQQQDAA